MALAAPGGVVYGFWLALVVWVCGVAELARRSSKYWLVLKTKQASSRDAVVNVRNQQFEYFHPLYRLSLVRGVRKVAPLFPYYLMVRVDDRKQDWKALCSTKGVQYVVGKARTPEVERIQELTNNTDDGYYHDPATAPPRFTSGESVEALRGLFQNKYGTYVGLAGNSASRVRVLFSILNRETEFEVCAYDLRSTSAPLLDAA